MNKRYQIFVSSTFVDLLAERAAAQTAILELDHMPAGMELFPATDDSAWGLIEDVIEASDYYLVIVGGRYGSTDERGVGYTEKEYDLALQLKRPVLAFLHHDPSQLPRDRTETNSDAWGRLESFRNRLKQRHTCVLWSNAHELKSKIIASLISAFKRNPAVGWVRADNIPSGATLSQILQLKNRVAELEAELQSRANRPPAESQHLAQGDDLVDLQTAARGDEFITGDGGATMEVHQVEVELHVLRSWNEIFSYLGPLMINEASTPQLRSRFDAYAKDLAQSELEKCRPELRHVSLWVDAKIFDTCIIQLRALGLITESIKKRSLKDTEAYWTLTPYGNNLLVRLRAISRESNPSPHTRSANDEPLLHTA